MASVREKRRTQAERSALSEKMILRAATRLIARHGYTKTTLAQIGRAAGYAAGMVSHRFGSKEGLLRTLVERIRTRFYQDQMGEALRDATGLAALLTAVDTYLNELRVREERMRVLYVLMGEALGPIAEVRPVVVKLNRGFRSSAEGWLRGGIRDGDVRDDVDPEIEAAVFVGMLRGVAMQWLAEREPFDLQAAAESIKDALRARLAPPRARRQPEAS